MAIKMHMPKLASVRGQALLTDTKPYLFRQSPVVAEMLDDMLAGGTVAWNQLVNGAGTATVTNNHKYVSHIGSTWSIAISNGSAISVGASDLVTDLTLMFSPTIADYVYTLEQSTAGSGIAWLKSYGFFTEDYYPYDAGSLLSVKTSGHRMVGFNQLDEDTILPSLGFTKESDGSFFVNISSSVADKVLWENRLNYFGQICITYNYKYDSASLQGVRFRIHYTDGTNVDKYATATTTYVKKVIVSTSGKQVEKIMTTYGTGTVKTWLKNICINISGADNGKYEPYTAHTYPLSDIELRGIPKLTDGQMYYDGDTYASDGTVTRKFGIRAYQAGDESDSTVITDRTNTVYPLVTPTTETTDTFTNPQTAGSTEEYIDERTVPMPVGHTTEYFNMVQKERISMHMPTHSPIKMHMEG